MRVRALKMGYYDYKRRREGEVFDMKDKDFMPRNGDGQPFMVKGKPYTCTWCEAVDAVSEVKQQKKGKPVQEVSNDQEVI